MFSFWQPIEGAVDSFSNSCERTRTLSHARYPVHNHLANVVFALTHHHDSKSPCKDINCLIGKHLINNVYLADDIWLLLAGRTTRSDTQTSYYSTISHTSDKSRRSTVVSPGVDARSSICLSTASQESKLDSLSETQDFLVHVCPIDYLHWDTFSVVSKMLQILKVRPATNHENNAVIYTMFDVPLELVANLLPTSNHDTGGRL